MRESAVEVAVCIVRAPDGRVLMAERTARQISAGFWELPGGKIDAGESAQAAAVRELAEEVGIRSLQLKRWLTYEYPYRLRRVRLSFFIIERWDGIPHGKEGQRLAWVDPAAPSVAPLLPSVVRILAGLALPRVYAVCRSCDHGGASSMLERIGLAVRSGLRLLQLREPDMAPDQRVALARRVNAVAAAAGARVLLTGSALEVRRAGLAGLHSTSSELQRLRARPQVSLWICSCHDERDLARASALGADAVVLSPVLDTATHRDRPSLGWEEVERLSTQASVPVYVQGGLQLSSLERALRAGTIGIATAHWSGTATEFSKSVPVVA